MNEIQIEIIELQVGQRLLTGGDHILRRVLVVPELGGNPQLLPLHARSHHLSQRAADLGLIAVNGGAVEMPVTKASRRLDGFGNPVRGNMIGAEGAQSNSRHPRSGVQRSLRHRDWIDSTGSLPIICLHPSLLDPVEPRRIAARRLLFHCAKLWQ